MRYWDTSTLAKLYVAESDSQQFSAHWSQTGVITTSALARWEIFCVFARKEADGLIRFGAAEIIFNEFLADVGRGAVVLVPMQETEEDRFRHLVLRLYRSENHPCSPARWTAFTSPPPFCMAQANLFPRT